MPMQCPQCNKKFVSVPQIRGHLVSDHKMPYELANAAANRVFEQLRADERREINTILGRRSCEPSPSPRASA